MKTSKLGLSEISIYLDLLYAWSIPYIQAKNDLHTTKATLASIYYYLLHTQQKLTSCASLILSSVIEKSTSSCAINIYFQKKKKDPNCTQTYLIELNRK